MDPALRVAERQYGAIKRAQLLEAGLSTRQIERWIAAGRIEVLFPTVYRVVGSVGGARQQALGACMWLGDEALVSHATAGALLHLDGIRTTDLHVTIPLGSRKGRGRSDMSLHRSSVPWQRRRRQVDGIPCTAATRTLIDVASTLDDETLESRLEVKLARLLRASLLPPSVAEFHLGAFRLDRAWPERRVAVEADGFQHHGRRLVWKRDRRRVAAIEAIGWRIVHVTWDDVVERPAETLDRCAIALGILAA